MHCLYQWWKFGQVGTVADTGSKDLHPRQRKFCVNIQLYGYPIYGLLGPCLYFVQAAMFGIDISHGQSVMLIKLLIEIV